MPGRESEAGEGLPPLPEAFRLQAVFAEEVLALWLALQGRLPEAGAGAQGPPKAQKVPPCSATAHGESDYGQNLPSATKRRCALLRGTRVTVGRGNTCEFLNIPWADEIAETRMNVETGHSKMAEQSLPRHLPLIECLQRHHNHFHAYYLHSSLFLLFVNTFFLGMSLYITWFY